MKTNREDIIQELKSLELRKLAGFKEKESSADMPEGLSSRLLESVMNKVKIEEEQHKVIPLRTETKQKTLSGKMLLRVAASFIGVIMLSGLTYNLFFSGKDNLTAQNGDSLTRLIAEASTEDIYNYLYETGAPADEEFLSGLVGDYSDVDTDLIKAKNNNHE